MPCRQLTDTLNLPISMHNVDIRLRPGDYYCIHFYFGVWCNFSVPI